MSKQPTRGHISVKGAVYWAFREACQESNLSMGAVLDDLIMAELDQISFGRADLSMDHGTMQKVYENVMDRELAKLKEVPTLGVTTPEQILAEFHHTFSVPNPPKSFCCIEENMGKGTEADLETFPTKDEAFAAVDPYHVEVTRKPPPALFSEEGLRRAAIAPQVKTPRSARGTGPVSADDVPSCIDPTFGKK